MALFTVRRALSHWRSPLPHPPPPDFPCAWKPIRKLADDTHPPSSEQTLHLREPPWLQTRGRQLGVPATSKPRATRAVSTSPTWGLTCFCGAISDGALSPSDPARDRDLLTGKRWTPAPSRVSAQRACWSGPPTPAWKGSWLHPCPAARLPAAPIRRRDPPVRLPPGGSGSPCPSLQPAWSSRGGGAVGQEGSPPHPSASGRPLHPASAPQARPGPWGEPLSL